MTPERATYRYFAVLIPAQIVFIVASIVIAYGGPALRLEGWRLYPATLVPILALLVTFWAHWRFVWDVDEFIRLVHIKALLAGLAVLMIFATSWGLFEVYAKAPAFPIFWLTPLFWAAYGLIATVLSWREGLLV